MVDNDILKEIDQDKEVDVIKHSSMKKILVVKSKESRKIQMNFGPIDGSQISVLII